MKSEAGELKVSYSARGIPRYELEIWHRGLNKYEVVRGDDSHVVYQKAKAKMTQWNIVWTKKQEIEERQAQYQNSVQLAAEKTEDAQKEQQKLRNILSHTLKVNDVVGWDKLKNLSDYSIPKPEHPTFPSPPILPLKPDSTDRKYKPKLTLLDRIFSSRKAVKEYGAAHLYKKDMKDYQVSCEKTLSQYDSDIKEIQTRYAKDLEKWQQDQKAYYLERDKQNAIIDAKHDEYWKGNPEAIKDYCDIILSNSEYPDYFPQSYSMEYTPENKMLVVDYQLPAPQDLPTVIEYNIILPKNWAQN